MKITLEVPDEVDTLIKSLGHDDSFYQYNLLETTRLWLENHEMVAGAPRITTCKHSLRELENSILKEWRKEEIDFFAGVPNV